MQDHDEQVNVFEVFRRLAAASLAEPTMESYMRQVFRYYSKTFHTPLHLVETLPLEHVLTAVEEDLVQSNYRDDEDREDLFGRILDPKWDEEQEENLQDFIDQVINDKLPKTLKKTSKPNDNNKLPVNSTQSLREMAQGSVQYEDEAHSLVPEGLDSLEQALGKKE